MYLGSSPASSASVRLPTTHDGFTVISLLPLLEPCPWEAWRHVFPLLCCVMEPGRTDSLHAMYHLSVSQKSPLIKLYCDSILKYNMGSFRLDSSSSSQRPLEFPKKVFMAWCVELPCGGLSFEVGFYIFIYNFYAKTFRTLEWGNANHFPSLVFTGISHRWPLWTSISSLFFYLAVDWIGESKESSHRPPVAWPGELSSTELWDNNVCPLQ